MIFAVAFRISYFGPLEGNKIIYALDFKWLFVVNYFESPIN